MTGLRTIGLIFVLMAMVAAVTTLTAAPSIYGDEPPIETTTLPTITISATGGVTPGALVTVTEGNPASFIVTADTAPAAPLEVRVAIFTAGDFSNIPSINIEGGPGFGYEVRAVTIAAGTTQAELAITTVDDTLEEESGSVATSVESQPHYTVGHPARAHIRVEDNDTVPPPKMEPPTVLPADGRIEIFWEEPTNTTGRRISNYLISWSTPSITSTYHKTGDQRHISIKDLVNGEVQTVQIQACKGYTYCSPLSDEVQATPTDSGPAMTGPPAKSLPEEIAGEVGNFTATPSPGGSITWRLGGSTEYVTQTMNSDGTMTLTLIPGVGFEIVYPSPYRSNPFGVTVVATDESTTDRASSVIQVDVTITDVDETPTFTETLIIKPAYVVGQRIIGFVIPPPKADETPVTYSMLTVDPITGLDLATERKLPPGLSLSQGRVINGIPTQVGTYTATYAATDVDGDTGTLDIQFTVVDTHTPTVAIQIESQLTSQTDSPLDIELTDKFEDPDGDTLIYTAASDNASVITAGIVGSILTLTPLAAGKAEITVTATDPSGRSGSQKFMAVVVPAANNGPTVATEIEDQYMAPTDSPRSITLADKFVDRDGDELTYTGTSGNTGVVTTGIANGTLTLTPGAEGTATITVTAADTGGLTISQEFTTTVASETIAVTPTGATISKGNKTTFLVTGTDLETAETYSLHISLDGQKTAFDQECTNREETGTLPPNQTGARSQSFDIYGCKLGEVEITAKLSLGTTTLTKTTGSATVAGLPDKPEITSVSTADGTISLQIELGHGVDSYVIQQGMPPTALPPDSYTKTPTNTGNTGATSSVAAISGLTNGVEYTYSVVSTNTHGSTTGDDHVVTLTAVELPIPTAPTGLQAVSTAPDSINLSWTETTGTAAYRLELRQTGDPEWTTESKQIETNPYTVTGLACNQSYTFRITGFGDDSTFAPSWGDVSSELSASTTLCQAPPPSSAGTISSQSLTLNWTDIPGVTKYQVQHREEGTANWTESLELLTSNYIFSGLTPGTTYEIQIRSHGNGTTVAAAWGRWSRGHLVTTSEPPSPDNLKLETAKVSGLHMSADPIDGADKYQLRYQPTGGTDWMESDEASSPELTVTGLNAGTAYSLQIRAQGDGLRYIAGWGEWSSTLGASTISAQGCDNDNVVPNHATNPDLVNDCATMLRMKTTLEGTATLNWATTLAINGWDGVNVSGTPNRVAELNLSSRGLNGTVPQEISQLTGITTIDLSMNSLTGEIPETLGNLKDLTDLSLHENQLTGCIPIALHWVDSNDNELLNLPYCGNNYEIASAFIGETFAQASQNQQLQSAETSLLNCVNQTGTSDKDSQPRAFTYTSHDTLLGEYTGEIKTLVDQCDLTANYFETLHQESQSSANQLRTNARYSGWAADPATTQVLDNFASPFVMRHYLEEIAKLNSDTVSARSSEQAAYPTAGTGMDCLPTERATSISGKLRVLNCLVFQTDQYFWHIGTSYAPLYRYIWPEGPTELKTAIESEFHNYLGAGDWECSSTVIENYRPACYKHDVAYESLQKFDGTPDTYELDRTWNPRNKSLADSTLLADSLMYGCLARESETCDATNKTLAFLTYEAVAKINDKDWPITEEDVDSYQQVKKFFDCETGIGISDVRVSTRYPLPENAWDNTYDVSWNLDNPGCTPPESFRYDFKVTVTIKSPTNSYSTEKQEDFTNKPASVKDGRSNYVLHFIDDYNMSDFIGATLNNIHIRPGHILAGEAIPIVALVEFP